MVDSARQIREFFADLGLVTFLKTTGGKGLHVVLPIDRRTDWDEAKQFCADVANAVATADPKRSRRTCRRPRGAGRFISTISATCAGRRIAPYSTAREDGLPRVDADLLG